MQRTRRRRTRWQRRARAAALKAKKEAAAAKRARPTREAKESAAEIHAREPVFRARLFSWFGAVDLPLGPFLVGGLGRVGGVALPEPWSGFGPPSPSPCSAVGDSDELQVGD